MTEFTSTKNHLVFHLHLLPLSKLQERCHSINLLFPLTLTLIEVFLRDVCDLP